MSPTRQRTPALQRPAPAPEREAAVAAPARRPRTSRRLQPLAPVGIALGLVVLGAVLAAAVAPALAAVAALGVVALVLDLAFGSPRRVLRLFPGETATPAAEPRLFNLLEGLCLANGLALPDVVLLEDPAANVLALRGTGGKGVLVVTRGLLGVMDRIGLEAALAHALAMDKLGAARDAARLRFGLGALVVLPRLQARLLWRLSDPARLVLADRAAVRMTRYPPGLRSCLEELSSRQRTPTALAPEAVRLSAQDWLVPLSEPPAVRRFELGVDLRTAALAEL